MNDYRYKLEHGSRKFICPLCGKKSFVKYIDTETGDYLPEQYGRCDHESKCSYHLNPYKDGYAKAIWEKEHDNKTNWKPQRPKLIKKPVNNPEPVFIPVEILNHTLAGYEQNVFIQNLLTKVAFPFKVKDIEKVISLYYLGTVQNGYRTGAVTFPFIDVQGNVRAIQVKQFNEQNHTTGTDWLHSIIEKQHTRSSKPLPGWLEVYNKNEKKVSCLFGEHLLNKYPGNHVALVEAPKTAVYGTLYFGLPEKPESFIWIAVYNKSSFSFDKLKILKGRFVYVFPDLSKDGSTFKEWQTKAKEYEDQLTGTRFVFSDLLERLATPEQRENGSDIADILINMDWQKFRHAPVNKEHTETKDNVSEQESPKAQSKIPKIITPTAQSMQQENIVSFLGMLNSGKKVIAHDWDDQISELETFFSQTMLPKEPVQMDACTVITDVSKFIEGNLAIVKANNGKRTFLPYLKQLQSFRAVCP